MTAYADPAPRRLRLPRLEGADPIRLIALAVAVLLVAAAILAPLVAPYDPLGQSLISRLRPPVGFERASPGHWLGTDELGRDVLSRALYGLRLTLALAGGGALIGLLIGGTMGLVAGLRRGWVEDLIMGLVDLQIAVPFTLIALLILALAGSSLEVLVLVLGIAGWEQYARIVRAETRRLAAQPFVESARAAGASGGYIARRHLLPNLVSPLVVQFTLALSNIVILESTLSFLGLGVQPPHPSLGSMVGLGRDYMPSAPWIVAVPALLIVLLTFAVQILGDWLRDRADVRLRER
ncbi:ABC transporter permease [Albimonas sp. CAU 1670]|uniref:ABC transporter permease n=1 Tax=Albimonas sp. CAU 1670 TaxID=3032599 RepID=UPI0023D9CE0B|nr:ABC transporter permease [Albimonas sp. CAU 1670]MDF2234763.1 ABC transporter permease [Albimonas sp. CAU 1670]